MIPVEFADEHLLLLHQRAIVWPRASAIIVADLHLGKAASFRAGGVPVPEGSTQADLARLSSLIEAHQSRHVIILGDMLHARSARSAQTLEAMRRWRESQSGLRITLIRGNHDLQAGDPPVDLGIEVLSEPAPYTGPPGPDFRTRLRFAHDPAILSAVSHASPAQSHRSHRPSNAAFDEKPHYTLCGHLHPAVSLAHPSGLASLRAPCFWFSSQFAVLPAFGSFTGAATIRPNRSDRIFPIGQGSIAELRTSTAN